MVGSPFTIYGDNGIGIVPIPGVEGALCNFKSIHDLYSCGIRGLGTLAQALTREEEEVEWTFILNVIGEPPLTAEKTSLEGHGVSPNKPLLRQSASHYVRLPAKRIFCTIPADASAGTLALRVLHRRIA
jgi:hypothetical protein